MRCYICNREDDLITWDRRHQDFGPCMVCEAIIQETLEEFGYDTEDFPKMDYPGSGQDDRPHGPGIEPVREGRRSG
jgi:hypothetical protein